MSCKNNPWHLRVLTTKWLTIVLMVNSAIAELYSPDKQPNFKERLQDSGVMVDLNLTTIYQQNTRGGLSTHRQQGRCSGSVDIEMTADLQRWFGIDSAHLYAHTESSWPTHDYNQTAVGSLWGINGDFAGRQQFSLIELWYQQSFFENTVHLRAGKLDITGGFEHHNCPISFDCNAYANDENTQFLNPALVNNPTIPFPDYGLGAIVLFSPIPIWYISFGAADTQADRRETGFKTAFHNRADFIYLTETGLLPSFSSATGDLQGAYRLGMWYDPQPMALTENSNTYRDNAGWYISADQLLAKETFDPEDTQGLGLFARYGYAPSRAYPVSHFVSAGLQYQGLLETRDDDTLGIGWARGYTSDKPNGAFSNDHESVLEIYYNMSLNPNAHLTPAIQYIQNPGADGQTRDALVLAVRLTAQF